MTIISLILPILLTSSPYPYEIDRGLSLEIKGGALVRDSSDDLATATGLRASYFLTNVSDAFLSLEAEMTFFYELDELRDRNGSSRNRKKYAGNLNLLAMEIYNPMAWRLAVGGGVERRISRISPTFDYRFGLGYFMSKDWGLWGDATGHMYFRKGSRTDQALELSLSLQHVF